MCHCRRGAQSRCDVILAGSCVRIVNTSICPLNSGTSAAEG